MGEFHCIALESKYKSKWHLQANAARSLQKNKKTFSELNKLCFPGNKNIKNINMLCVTSLQVVQNLNYLTLFLKSYLKVYFQIFNVESDFRLLSSLGVS